MAVQKGVGVLIRVGDGEASEDFVVVGGARVISFTLNNQPVDATSASSTGQWRQLIDAAGILSMDASFTGVMQVDGAGDTRLRTITIGRTLRNFELVVPTFGTFTGPFIVTNLTYGGAHDGEMTFELSLQSGGQVAFA